MREFVQDSASLGYGSISGFCKDDNEVLNYLKSINGLTNCVHYGLLKEDPERLWSPTSLLSNG
jgi:hypothetical protein